MNSKSKREVTQTYPNPQWVRDPVDKSLEFDVAKHYRIKTGVPLDSEGSEGCYQCPYCLRNKLNTILFLRERKNINKFKCITCHSIIETE